MLRSDNTTMRRPNIGMPIYISLILACACGAAFGDTVSLPNFHTVGPGIYRGAAPTPAGLKELRGMGVKTIVDLRISPRMVKQEAAQARAMGFRWVNLPMGSDPPTEKQVTTLMAILKQAPGQPVFVHCQHGADRTGCMIGIYRITQQQWAFPRAWAEMRRYGFNPHWAKLTAAVRRRAAAHPAASR